MHRTAHVISSLAFFLFILFAAMGAAGCVRPIAVHDGARLPVPQTTSTEDLDSGFAPEVSGEIAVITFVEGDVFIDEPLASIRSPGLAAPALQPTRRAYPYSRVRSGSTIRVGDNSRTTVVGDNDRVVTGRSGSTIVVNKSTFAKGQRLPANSSRRVATSSRGNLQVNNGSVRLSEILRPSFKESNKEDYGNMPIIQAPRNSSLLTLKPVIVWTSMADAVEYVLSLSSMDPYPPITLGLDEFECIDHEMAQPGQLCTVPWPEDWPIETGNIYYLQISARKGVAAPLIASEKSRLKPLKAEDVEFLTTETAALESLDIDDATRHVLLAGLLAEYELYGDAIAAYQAALALQPVPGLYVTLGDMYGVVGLNRPASRAYEDALALLDEGPDDLLVRAEARFGQGLVAYSLSEFGSAESDFEDALELYRDAGVVGGIEIAEAALEKTRARTSQN